MSEGREPLSVTFSVKFKEKPRPLLKAFMITQHLTGLGTQRSEVWPCDQSHDPAVLAAGTQSLCS